MTQNERKNREAANDNDESRKGVGEEDAVFAHATPSKKTYESISSDVSVESAVGELIDNALDAAALHGLDTAQVEIKLEQEGDEDVFVVRDACGGVGKDEMGVFMGLGRSRDERADEQNVGTFGMGAKRALRRCGREFTIRSQHIDADQGWEYTVPAEWFEVDEEDPSEWRFEMERTELEDPWSTELRIYDLEFDWESRREDLKDWAATTYQKFLQVESTVDLDLDLIIDDETVSAPDPVEWSFPPWADGLHPYRFEGLVFADHNGEGEVQARVTVGLMREGDAKRCGTFVFCQHRLVEGNLRDETGGYGLSGGLPKFKLSQHKRLRIEIELLGDASDLPWSADKSRLRPSHPILSPSPSRGVYWWLKRMADRHMRAGKYGTFGDFVKTGAVFEPYGEGSDMASNNGEIEVVDVGDKQRRLRRGEVGHIRITQKPSNDFGAINRLGEVAYTHAKLGIIAENMGGIETQKPLGELGTAHYAERCRPSYEYMVGQHFADAYYNRRDGQFTEDQAKQLLQVDDPDTFLEEVTSQRDWARIARNLATVAEVPNIEDWEFDDDSKDDVDVLLSEIEQVARESVNDESLRSDDPEWAAPYYRAAVAVYATEQGVSAEEFEEVEEPIFSDTDDAGDEAAVPDSGEGDESATVEEEGGDEASVSAHDDGGDVEVGTRNQNTTQRNIGGSESDGDSGREQTTITDEESDDDISFREFCRENMGLLYGVDEETLGDDLDQLIEQVREQLDDGRTFREIRRGAAHPSGAEAE